MWEIETPSGPARVSLFSAAEAGGAGAGSADAGSADAGAAGVGSADAARAASSRGVRARSAAGALVLGHGAGGGFGARDLVAATEVAVTAGLAVAHVEQPYRVAGRRSPAPAAQLDAAWAVVVEELAGGELAGLPLIVGGRSAGARVACRTAAACGAAGVLCLAFPVHPPGRPEKSRLAELDAVEVPVLVVQGESDPFGMPPPAPGRTVVAIRGNHSLSSDLPGLRAAADEWLVDMKRAFKPGSRRRRSRSPVR